MASSLSIVLPAYNEQDNVQAAVTGAARAAASVMEDYEVVVVDDGSRDGTAARLAALGGGLGPRLRVLRHEVNQGYGAALRAGFRAARGDLVFYTDSDNQFDLAELAAAVPLMDAHDAVLGYRVRRQDPFARLCTSAVFNRITCLALGVRVRDLNCSFKLFRREVLHALPLQSDDFFIDAELVALLHRAGARYTQIPVRHLPRLAGRSTVRASDVPRTLRSLARMRARLRQAPAPAAVRDARP
ncbi:MAG TPA: glycosyltransferase family 2 protein [Vicinamibacteria bacterium]|jgi:glycosyltransferase involved in cell wall biosynthesis